MSYAGRASPDASLRGAGNPWLKDPDFNFSRRKGAECERTLAAEMRCFANLPFRVKLQFDRFQKNQ